MSSDSEKYQSTITEFYKWTQAKKKLEDKIRRSKRNSTWRKRKRAKARKRKLIARTRVPQPKLENGKYVATVYTYNQLMKLRHTGVQKLDIIHFSQYPSEYTFWTAITMQSIDVQYIRFPDHIDKRLEKTSWLQNLPKKIKNRIMVGSCEPKFWTEEMKDIVKRLVYEGDRALHQVAALIYRHYGHKITTSYLYHKMQKWRKQGPGPPPSFSW
jgi:hypothetical protein